VGKETKEHQEMDMADYNEASRNYWQLQDEALARVKSSHGNWTKQRRAQSANSKEAQTWKRVSFSLPRVEAQKKAREFFDKYPKAAYWSEVESWRELPGDVIEFTMRRLPSAD
jgi:hypothetical protein